MKTELYFDGRDRYAIVENGFFFLFHIEAAGEVIADIIERGAAAALEGIYPDGHISEDDTSLFRFRCFIEDSAHDVWRALTTGLPSWQDETLAFYVTAYAAGEDCEPAWVREDYLSYLVNGDATGLEDNELNDAMAVDKQLEVLSVCPESSNCGSVLCLVRYK